jgi:Fe-S-cluster containining protein
MRGTIGRMKDQQVQHGLGELPSLPSEQEECGTALSISLVEKYLLRLGWSLADTCDSRTNLITTLASAGELGPFLSYAKPSYSFTGRNRKEDLSQLIQQLSILEGVTPEIETRRIHQKNAAMPEGYICRRCGKCCTQMRDAFQGLVSEEEVDSWRALGLTRILRLVEREERKGYTIYTAWKNPKTHKFFRRCPWNRKVPGESNFFCAIHEHKPIKCRAFPLSRLHAEYAGCPGFVEQEQSLEP